MLLTSKNKERPFHWGPFALERLPHDETVAKTEAATDATPRPTRPSIDPDNLFGRALLKYHGMFGATGIVDPLPERAPVPDDLKRRSQDVKGAGFFLDAAGMGICKISENSWFTGSKHLSHTHAVVVVIQHGRTPEEDNLAHAWVNGLEAAAAEVRAFQIAIAVAEHIQWMGFAATAHDAREGAVNLERLAVLSGLAVRDGDTVVHPFMRDAISLAAVTTEYEMACDTPLCPSTKNSDQGLGYL